MRLVCETDIEAPIEKTAKLLGNPANAIKWMQGLTDYKQISGEPGAPGATFCFIGETNFDGRIISRDLPNEFTFTLEGRDTFVTVTAKLSVLSPTKTHYTLDQEFKFTGASGGTAGPHVLTTIKERQHKDVQDFKRFVEAQPS